MNSRCHGKSLSSSRGSTQAALLKLSPKHAKHCDQGHHQAKPAVTGGFVCGATAHSPRAASAHAFLTLPPGGRKGLARAFTHLAFVLPPASDSRQPKPLV